MKLFPTRKRVLVNPKLTFVRLLTFLTGILLYSLAFNIFFLPAEIVMGGISGISIIMHHFFGIVPALFILLMSVILLIVSFILLTKRQTMAYLSGAFILPLFIELTSSFSELHYLNGADPFIVVLFGGLIAGVGAGLIFKAGFLTGEIDIPSHIASKYLKITPNKAGFYIGTIIIFIGGIIPTAGVYNFTKVMYAIVALYISTTVAEKVIIGISSNKTFYIFTDKVDEVKNYIIEGFNASLTIMKATGGYNGQRENVLMCVIPTRDYFKIREGLRLIDNEAFFVATDAYETTRTKIKER